MIANLDEDPRHNRGRALTLRAGANLQFSRGETDAPTSSPVSARAVPSWRPAPSRSRRKRRDHLVWERRGLITVTTGGQAPHVRPDRTRLAQGRHGEYLPGPRSARLRVAVVRRYDPVRRRRWRGGAGARPARRTFPDFSRQTIFCSISSRSRSLRATAAAGNDLLWAELRWAVKA